MADKIDVIGVMCSGIPYACNVALKLMQDGNDARLLAYYPVNLSLSTYLDMKNNETIPERYDYNRATNKLDYFRTDGAKYLDDCLKDIRKIYKNYYGSNFIPMSPPASIYNSITEAWFNHMNRVDSNSPCFNYVSDEQFISDPKVRLSKEPDITRKVLICDDFVNDRSTLYHSIHDMFKMGYVEVSFLAEFSDSDQTSFVGNHEVFKKDYLDDSKKHKYYDLII